MENSCKLKLLYSFACKRSSFDLLVYLSCVLLCCSPILGNLIVAYLSFFFPKLCLFRELVALVKFVILICFWLFIDLRLFGFNISSNELLSFFQNSCPCHTQHYNIHILHSLSTNSRFELTDLYNNYFNIVSHVRVIHSKTLASACQEMRRKLPGLN